MESNQPFDFPRSKVHGMLRVDTERRFCSDLKIGVCAVEVSRKAAEEQNEKGTIKKRGHFCPRNHQEIEFCFGPNVDYFPLNFVITLAKASPFRSMAYSTVSFEPVDEVCRSVS